MPRRPASTSFRADFRLLSSSGSEQAALLVLLRSERAAQVWPMGFKSARCRDEDAVSVLVCWTGRLLVAGERGLAVADGREVEAIGAVPWARGWRGAGQRQTPPWIAHARDAGQPLKRRNNRSKKTKRSERPKEYFKIFKMRFHFFWVFSGNRVTIF